jgi:hypothetical protein
MVMETNIVFSGLIGGLPPDKDEGTFIGFDEHHNPYILKWRSDTGCWYGTGNDPQPHERHEFLPLHFLARGTMEGFIVRHARIMLVANPPSLDETRESFGHKDDHP